MHKAVVDRNHIDQCNLIQNNGKTPTHYNKTIEEMAIGDWDNETAEAIRTHFSALAKTIKVLTEKEIFSMTDRAERVAQ